jgi:hypothetical protein
MESFGKGGQFLERIMVPVHSKEMVKENINHNARMFPETWPKFYNTLIDNAMCISKRIDEPVQHDPLRNNLWIVHELPPFHKITDEVPKDHLFGLTGQINM